METENTTTESNIAKEQNSQIVNTGEEATPIGGKEYTTESTLYAEPIAHFGNFTVTNSLFTSWVVVFILIVISIVVKMSIKKIPRGIQNLSC